ncbi:MAG: tRNA (5-methylaminomethyl-2-thiouridine)(34)-methyltransferase MnmD [Bacteroidota bacterium]
MEDPQIITTEDGSHSLKHHSFDEHYHSTFGAISESRHVFIGAGLHYLLSEEKLPVRILEVGFGTGLNALLSLYEAMNSGQKMHYTTLEPFPLKEEIWRGLNYPGLVQDTRAGEWFENIHNAPWNMIVKLTPVFTLEKRSSPLQDIKNDEEPYKLIYFDAFGPDVQAEMWTEEIFKLIYRICAPGAVLVTYSAKGSVRRAMQAAGFKVERIPGPKGKREMMRGVKFEV